MSESQPQLAQRAPAADAGDVDVAWADLNGFHRELVKAVSRIEYDGEEVYGQRIKDEVERVIDGEVTHGRLYPNLDDLVEAGYLTRERQAIDDRTHRIELTAAGHAALVEQLRRLADATGLQVAVTNGGDAPTDDDRGDDHGGDR